MTLNKKYLLSLTLALSVSVIAACSNEDEGNVAEVNEENNEEVETQEEEPVGDNEVNEEVALEDALAEEELAEQPEMDMPEPDLESIPDVVAEVNGDEIPRDEFVSIYQQQFQYATMMGGAEVDEDQMKQELAENMIGTQLLIQEADRNGFEATEDEVNETLDEIVAQNGLESREEFFSIVGDQGMDEDEIMSQLETEVKVEQLIASELGDNEPTDEELQEFYDQMVAQQEEMAGETEEEIEIPSFEEVKDDLVQHVKDQQETELLQTLIAELREDADVTIYL
ncbi:SurA N-terminal domain-containing protein [Salipaludibacillus sp. HK11]|uniref:SurA N-terminal domain-containing protein n=1 Tax=Salipaludibacillus sp. HK11 TaxID=3394320 RepID=UPI0039FDABEA